MKYMQIEILKEDKSEIEFRIDNQTIAEVLREVLYEKGADFAAWRKEHPSKPVIMRVHSNEKSVKKVISEAIAELYKRCDSYKEAVKK